MSQLGTSLFEMRAIGSIIAMLVVLYDCDNIAPMFELTLNDFGSQLMCLEGGEGRTFFWNSRRKRVKNK